jgi:hypothetical protein
MQISPAAQHSQPYTHGVSPGAHVSGSHDPSTHDWQSPHEGTQSLGSHW